MDVHEISMNCKRTEFVGTAVLDTIGLCIAGVDDTLLKTMNIGTRYHALGLFSSRTGAAGQLTAMDEAVKSTDTEFSRLIFPETPKAAGGPENGHRRDRSRRCAMPSVQPLNLPINMQASSISAKPATWNLPIPPAREASLKKPSTPRRGQAFGFMAGSPAAIGLVMADTAMKAASVQIARYMTPSLGTSHSNEVILALSGTADAAKEAVLSARRGAGLELLMAMGSCAEIPGTPYLV